VRGVCERVKQSQLYVSWVAPEHLWCVFQLPFFRVS
jgi:hypothetical protein